MGTTPDQLKTEIDRTRDDLTTNVNALADKVSPARMTRRRLRAVKDGATGVRDRVMGAGDATDGAADRASSARETASGAMDSVADAPHQVARRTQGNPLPVGLMAFGAGALLATLLPDSDAETRMAATLRDGGIDVVGAAKSAATESAQRLKEGMTGPAQQALASVKESATGAVDKTRARAEQAADDVAGHGERAARQVRGRARTAKKRTTASTRAASNGGAKASDVHVVHKDGMWVVEQKGAGVLSSHRTQALAAEAGRRRARRDRTEFVLHAMNGRIRAKDSYGNDPRGRG